jgi:hypothetical protein
MGCVALVCAWIVTFGLIGAGWAIDSPGLMSCGLAMSALGAALMILRDNQRTRRLILRRNDARDAELRRV